MSDLIVACAADPDHTNGYFSVLRSQVERAGLPFVYECILPFSWKALLEWELYFCRRHVGSRVVFVDAADFLMVGSAAELDAIVPRYDILFHGEARCWPEPHKADIGRYASERHGPYPFVNGTGPAGSAEVIADTIAWGFEHCPIRGREASIFADNDQRMLTDCYLAGYGHVDQTGALSAQLNAIGPSEVRIEYGRLVLPNGSRPVFVHLNGAAKTTYARIIAELAR